jgi:hypothetical protein
MDVSPPIQSGSNGPIAKECHRFLVAGPFKLSAVSYQPSAFSCPSTRFFSPRGWLAVSKPNVKALRYSLLLPLIHLPLSLPLIYHEEALYWRYIPRIEVVEDFEKTPPPPILHSGPMIAWNPCYEYRPSTADKFIFLVEFPAGMLIPPHGASACNPTVLRPILQKLKSWIRLKTRVVVLDCLLIFGIATQWRLVGGWLERLLRQHGHRKCWIIPVVTITIAGIAVAASTFGNWRSLELGAAILSLIAFLAGVMLLLMFNVTAARWAIRFGRKTRATQ